MRYLPHTDAEIKSMLKTIGASSIDELFSCIPDRLRLKTDLSLPPSLSESELRVHMRNLSRKNAHDDEWISFLGAGSYNHYIPSVVQALIGRGEFLTAYTPYQPEVSQGTLQALFEFQTMIAELLGLEIANASNYDGASSAAEAALMALRMNRRKRLLIARSINPEYREVIETYLRYVDVQIEYLDFDPQTGTLDRTDLEKKLKNDLSCVIISYPNFFGILESLDDIAASIHDAGALLITATPEPWCLALAKSPGEWGADIATAEGQSFGNPISFGGPSLGLFATHKKHARQIPGRLVGETVDSQGQRGYVLTLATREQHIRRGRATSNICTNVNLCALAATITLSLLGPNGFQRIASENLRKSERAKQLLTEIPGVSLGFSSATFNEFALKLPKDPKQILSRLLQENILGGVALGRWYLELENYLLINVTEMNADKDIEVFGQKLKNIITNG